MLSSLSRLFNHYCDHHYTVNVAGFPIFDGDGNKLGHVDKICFGRSSVRIQGWSVAEKVALGQAAKSEWERPDLKRPDVNAALKLAADALAGFNLVWFGDINGLMLSVRSESMTLRIQLPDLNKLAVMKAQVHIRVNFAKSVMRAFPALARAYLRPCTINKSAAKRALGMRESQLSHILDTRFFEKSKVPHSTDTITLVMPVYNAFDVLCEALQRIAKHTELPWRLILVEDCSTDARIRPMLRKWSDVQRSNGNEIILLENSENLGFIGSVNRAFGKALSFGDHVILINSDALLPQDWAQRLISPILQNPRIASVTPLSNDAEIFTAPTICKRYDLKRGEADLIDAFLAGGISNQAYQTVPTGVGYCMALNKKFLSKFPDFDTVFGKGYGEEVDWCRRVGQYGGLHVVQPNLFVEHRGGTSFGNHAKQIAIARNNKIISKRYPDFDQSVQTFIANDPVRTARVLTAFGLLSAGQNDVQIYIGHSLGGGAELYLQEQIADRLDKGLGAIVLRVGGPFRWRIEAHLSKGMVFVDTDDDADMMRLLSDIPNAEIIYSCAVGDTDPVSLPTRIRHLIEMNSTRFTVLVHDFFVVSPSYCLLDSDEVFRPALLHDTDDRAHTILDKKGKTTNLKKWRANWLDVLQMATQIKCFSQSSAKIIKSAFPTLGAEISVNPHKIEKIRKVVSHADLMPGALGVLGDIGIQKGAKSLESISKALPNEKISQLVIIGRLDPRYSLTEVGVETGAYKRSEIPRLAEQHRLKAWIIPSIWPETFSYTTHEALATGLPVFCFDIGAQQEAVERASNGYVLPLAWANKPDQILSYISEVLDNDAIRRRIHTGIKRPRRRGITAQFKSAG